MKRCPMCNSEKDEEAFGKDRRRKNGLAVYCRDCMKIRNQAWYYRDVEHARKLSRENRQRHLERSRETSRAWYWKNRARSLNATHQWYLAHKDEIRASRKRRYTLKKRGL